MLWACTSGSFVHGREGALVQARWLAEAGRAPASSTSWAFSAAVRHLGARRVAVAATYPADVAARFTAFLAGDGITVTALSAHGVPSGEDAGRLDAEWLLGAARAADVRGAECLLVPDTALHTVTALPELERALGLPVLASLAFRRLTVHAGMVLTAAGLVACYFVFPQYTAGTYGIDVRFALMAALAAVAALRPDLPPRPLQVFAASLLAVSLVRTGFVGWVWHSRQADVAAVSRALDALPPGVALLPAPDVLDASLG